MSIHRLFIIFAFLSNSMMIVGNPPVSDDAQGASPSNRQTPSIVSYASHFPGVNFIPIASVQVTPNVVANAVNQQPTSPRKKDVTASSKYSRPRAQSDSSNNPPTDITAAVAMKRSRSLLNQLLLVEELKTGQ